MARRISNRERHIRWNWEESPDDPELARYHFVIVDDKYREKTLEKFLHHLQSWGGPINRVRETGGKVKGTEYRYLFVSCDSNQAPKMLSSRKVSLPIKRDGDLRERVRGSIEDYVAKTYE
jgi:hypothetical protein